jgi:type II restriction/modification system DNA methylase subunit YeeA
MLSLNNRINEIGDKRTDERTRIEMEIKKNDAEIDELIYQLYDITEDEKKIIEESLNISYFRGKVMQIG